MGHVRQAVTTPAPVLGLRGLLLLLRQWGGTGLVVRGQHEGLWRGAGQKVRGGGVHVVLGVLVVHAAAHHVLLLSMRAVAAVREAALATVAAVAVHKVPYFLFVVADVVRQLRLLEAGRAHALVAAAVAAAAARRRAGVRRVEARLDQGLTGLRRDHGLQLTRGEGVDVAGLGRHQQHHLRARQRRELVRLQQTAKVVGQ